jgi:hypothetical protein
MMFHEYKLSRNEFSMGKMRNTQNRMTVGTTKKYPAREWLFFFIEIPQSSAAGEVSPTAT